MTTFFLPFIYHLQGFPFTYHRQLRLEFCLISLHSLTTHPPLASTSRIQELNPTPWRSLAFRGIPGLKDSEDPNGDNISGQNGTCFSPRSGVFVFYSCNPPAGKKTQISMDKKNLNCVVYIDINIYYIYAPSTL